MAATFDIVCSIEPVVSRRMWCHFVQNIISLFALWSSVVTLF